jgi:hypothetical protein
MKDRGGASKQPHKKRPAAKAASKSPAKKSSKAPVKKTVKKKVTLPGYRVPKKTLRAGLPGKSAADKAARAEIVAAFNGVDVHAKPPKSTRKPPAKSSSDWDKGMGVSDKYLRLTKVVKKSSRSR